MQFNVVSVTLSHIHNRFTSREITQSAEELKRALNMDTTDEEIGEGEAVSDDNNVSVSATAQVARIGGREKCPICGTQIDPEAYHCPACHNYYCFHCRARLLGPDVHLQCFNQQCEYYGKLVCNLCDAAAEKEEPPMIYAEARDGFWPALLLLIILVSPLVWYYTTFLIAMGSAIAAFVVGGYALQLLGLNIFGREENVELARKSTYYTCLGCHQPVRELEGI